MAKRMPGLGTACRSQMLDPELDDRQCPRAGICGHDMHCLHVDYFALQSTNQTGKHNQNMSWSAWLTVCNSLDHHLHRPVMGWVKADFSPPGSYRSYMSTG